MNSEESAGLPLAGVRVLELCDWISGPFAAMMLGDFGAEVIKVELPDGLGNSRTTGTLEESDATRSTYFAASARNKRSITLDVRSERGREVLLDLVGVSDVLIESFRPGTLERWQLGWEHLTAANPALVLLRISGFGQTGPLRERPGFDRVAQAFGGLTYVTGDPDGPPVRAGMGVADYGTGLLGVIGILLALRERAVSGQGQVVDLALYESIVAIQGAMAVDFMRYGSVRERSGNAVPGVAPGGAYLTAEGDWVQISASGDAVFARLAEAMDRSDLTGDPRFATGSARSQHRDELEDLVTTWVGGHSTATLEQVLAEGGIPCSRILSIADVVGHPHVVARGNYVECEDPAFGSVGMVAPLPRLSRTPGRIASTGPAKGAHTRAVLGDLLGLSPDEITRLERDGVVAPTASDG